MSDDASYDLVPSFAANGTYRIARVSGEEVRAFVPHPLPPTDPPLDLTLTLHQLDCAPAGSAVWLWPPTSSQDVSELSVELFRSLPPLGSRVMGELSLPSSSIPTVRIPSRSQNLITLRHYGHHGA